MKWRHGTSRVRLRLIVAFIAVAALTASMLGVGSYVIIHRHRVESFTAQARSEVRLLLLPSSEPSVEELRIRLEDYQRRAGFDAVFVDGGLQYASSAVIGLEQIPARLRSPLNQAGVQDATTEIDGRSYLVVASTSPESPLAYYFFYERDALLEQLAEIRRALAVGSVVSVAFAALLGRTVARRTLKPVRVAADASQALADGLLGTRIEAPSDDEFGRWAQAFNRMAGALQAKIDELSRAADRERHFTAAVAHDLRTPLTTMVSAAELIRPDVDRLEPIEARRPAMLLNENVDRLHRLVLQLLELARLDADGTDIEPSTFALLDVVEGVVSSQPEAVNFSVRVDPSLRVVGDRRCTGSILANFVNNAVAHGRPPVEITAARSNGDVHISVRDHGAGIPPAALTHVFDRFYKIDSARSTRGSGLGLALAQRYAAIQGSQVGVRNHADGGACFTLVMPNGSLDSTMPPDPDDLVHESRQRNDEMAQPG